VKFQAGDHTPTPNKSQPLKWGSTRAEPKRKLAACPRVHAGTLVPKWVRYPNIEISVDVRMDN